MSDQYAGQRQEAQDVTERERERGLDLIVECDMNDDNRKDLDSEMKARWIA
jgi:hypothetical protein